MSHLVLKANRKPLVLDEDFQLQVEDPNPLFNDRSMYSYPVTIPLDGNRHYVRNIEDHQSDDRPVDLEHADMQIEVEGIPFRHGTAIISEDEHLTNRLSLNIDANEVSFSDLIADLNCRDVRVKDDIIIGHKLSDIRIIFDYVSNFGFTYGDGEAPQPGQTYQPFTGYVGSYEGTMSALIDTLGIGFSEPGDFKGKYIVRHYKEKDVYVPSEQRMYINTSAAYGDPDNAGRKATYCNARVCYRHFAKDSDGATSSENVSRSESTNLYEDIYPYWVLDADRAQSGICFYILYFLECLFKQIGYSYDISELMAVEDFRRLHFFTTRCKYDIRESDKALAPTVAGNVDTFNTWLREHGCAAQLSFKENYTHGLQVSSLSAGENSWRVGEKYAFDNGIVAELKYIDVRTWNSAATFSSYILPMYANSDNFPDMSVTSLLDSLENQFGIKFLVDEDKHHVHCTLLRSVFRDPQPPINLPMQIDSIAKISEKITGVKVGYSAESDAKEQQNNIKYGVRDYDTDYDYCSYPKERTVIGNGIYKKIFRAPNSNDMNVYVDLDTGNRYRIKIDSDAQSVADMHPVVVEVGQYHHVEFGDCATINEDYIRELRSDLQPVPLNDVNYYNEISTQSESVSGGTFTLNKPDGSTVTSRGAVEIGSLNSKPILVPYCDKEMEHEFVEQNIDYPIGETFLGKALRVVLSGVESYDPTKTEDGNSPLQDDIWGTAIAIMRGGGGGDGIMLYDNNYDFFSNSKWRGTVGNYQISTDNITQFAEGYDYNLQNLRPTGYVPEQFSLKPRAYVTVPWSLEGSESRNYGVTEARSDGTTELRNDGSTELRNDGNTELRNYGTTESVNPEIRNSVNPSLLRNSVNPEIRNSDLVVADDKVKSRGYADRFLREYVHFLLKRKHFVIEGKMEPALLADIPNHWTRRFKVGTLIGYIDRITYNIDVRTGIRKCQLYFYTI